MYAFKGLQQRVQTFPLSCSTWKLQVKRVTSCKSWSYESRLLVSGALGSSNQNTHQQTFQNKFGHTGLRVFFPFSIGFVFSQLFGCHTVISHHVWDPGICQGTQSKTCDFLCLKTWGTNRRSGSSTYLCYLSKNDSFTALPIENLQFSVLTFSEKQFSINSAAMFVRGVAHQSVTFFFPVLAFVPWYFHSWLQVPASENPLHPGCPQKIICSSTTRAAVLWRMFSNSAGVTSSWTASNEF